MPAKLLFLLLLIIPFAGADAAAPLIYREKVNGLTEQGVLTFLEQRKFYTESLPYQMATADLNDDGVDEWIFRQDAESGCEQRAACRYILIGLSEQTPILLGDVTARKIEIMDLKTYGVHRLGVYNRPENDFDRAYYVWTPDKRTFLPQ